MPDGGQKTAASISPFDRFVEVQVWDDRACGPWPRSAQPQGPLSELMKVDFKKSLPGYAAKRNQFSIIELPKMQYLMVDGHGDPNTSVQFKTAVEALYPVAYALKFMSKVELGNDYVVPPLEGLWWAQDMAVFTSVRTTKPVGTGQ